MCILQDMQYKTISFNFTFFLLTSLTAHLPMLFLHLCVRVCACVWQGCVTEWAREASMLMCMNWGSGNFHFSVHFSNSYPSQIAPPFLKPPVLYQLHLNILLSGVSLTPCAQWVQTGCYPNSILQLLSCNEVMHNDTALIPWTQSKLLSNSVGEIEVCIMVIYNINNHKALDSMDSSLFWSVFYYFWFNKECPLLSQFLISFLTISVIWQLNKQFTAIKRNLPLYSFDSIHLFYINWQLTISNV